MHTHVDFFVEENKMQRKYNKICGEIKEKYMMQTRLMRNNVKMLKSCKRIKRNYENSKFFHFTKKCFYFFDPLSQRL